MNRPHVDLSGKPLSYEERGFECPPLGEKKGFVLCHLPYKGRTRGVGRGWGLA